MAPLVSVIIPCYNSEKWVAEAVESCLNQTHHPIEIIVLDDGSTDGSLEILHSFGSKIRLETGPNRGANVARNRGLELAHGEYIQFLDADDYLLPDKIANQVSYLISTNVDIVYGDWRYQFHSPDGSVRMGKFNVPGNLSDPLEALLGGWFVPPNAYLFRSKSIMAGGGWDESLKRAQDTDFMISLAQTGASFGYQTGCGAVYRSYKDQALFWSAALGGEPWGEHFKVMKKAEAALRATGNLTPQYRAALARSYFLYAKCYHARDRRRFWEFIAEGRRIAPGTIPQGSVWYQLIVKVLGFGVAETLAAWKRRLVKRPAPE